MSQVEMSDRLKERVAFYESLIEGSRYDEHILARMAHMPKGAFLFLRHAREDNIRRWADGIGDLNPRFRDIDYARGTKYGRLVAPPLFLTGVCGEAVYLAYTAIASPKYDFRGFHSSSNWEFSQPVLEDDSIAFEGQGFTGVRVVDSRFSGQMLISSGEIRYTNQRGELVGRCRVTAHESAGNDTATSVGKYKDIDLYRYSAEELEKIEADKDAEEMRGSIPRYWEDVAEGDSVGQIVVGPYTTMNSLAYYSASPNGSASCKGERIARLFAKNTGPMAVQHDPRINASVNGMLSHLDNDMARQAGAGIPGAYDIGMERQCFVSTLFNNWIGDDGFLWKFSIQFRQFVIYGDTNWYKGAVTRKYVEDGRYCVDIDYQGVNQRGATTTAGSATVILPSRDHGAVKYPSH
ncbi:MaoC family dehydratase N-terminal domain-containing protein [soil metagenome]